MLIYSTGAIGTAPIGVLSLGDSTTYPLTTTPEVTPPGIAWGGDGALVKVRRRWVVRVGKRLVEYATAYEAEEAMQALEDEKRRQSRPTTAREQKPKKSVKAPLQQVESEQVSPAQTVYIERIKELARQYDEMAAYRAAMERQQYAEVMALFERLQDEADIEQLLLSIA